MPPTLRSAELIAGLDIGTTSVSAVAVSATGPVESCVSIPHHATVEGLPPGVAEQSPERLWSAAVSCLKQVCADGRGNRIRGIGLTGQMHSTVLLDVADVPVMNVVTWQDRRAVSGTAPVILDRLLQQVHPDRLTRAGCRLAAGYLGTTIYALRELGQWPAACDRVSFVAGWIAGRLCGERPVCDRSHAASSGLYDVSADRWNDALLAAVGTTPEQLPALRSSGSAVGTVTRELATELEVPEGTPVCNAVGDNQASVMAALPQDPDCLLINIGTGGQIVWRIPSPICAPQIETRPLPADAAGSGDIRESLMAVGAGLCGGDAIAWWNRTVQTWLAEFGVQLSADEIWQRMTARGDERTAAEQLSCQPVFRGTRFEPQRRGVIEQIGWDNFTPATLLHAIYDGIASLMHAVRDSAATDTEPRLRTVWMSGNGARKNPGLVAAVRQKFGVPVEVCRFGEEAATGAALLAGVRCGVWTGIEAARQIVQNETVAVNQAPTHGTK